MKSWNQKIDQMEECLAKHEGTKFDVMGSGFGKYFDLIFPLRTAE